METETSQLMHSCSAGEDNEATADGTNYLQEPGSPAIYSYDNDDEKIGALREPGHPDNNVANSLNAQVERRDTFELRWVEINELSPEWLECLVLPTDAVQKMVVRSVLHPPSLPRPPSLKLALQATELRTRLWQFTDDAIIRFNWPQAQSTSTPATPLIIELALSPRRGSDKPWYISVSFALHFLMATLAIDQIVTLTVPARDHRDNAVGIARLQLRWVTRSLLVLHQTPVPIIAHREVPLKLRVTIQQVQCHDKSNASVKVVFHLWSCRRGKRSANHSFRSQPMGLSAGESEPVKTASVPCVQAILEIEDAVTDLIVLAVYRYHIKERAHLLARGWITATAAHSPTDNVNGTTLASHSEINCVESWITLTSALEPGSSTGHRVRETAGCNEWGRALVTVQTSRLYGDLSKDCVERSEGRRSDFLRDNTLRSETRGPLLPNSTVYSHTETATGSADTGSERRGILEIEVLDVIPVPVADDTRRHGDVPFRGLLDVSEVRLHMIPSRWSVTLRPTQQDPKCRWRQMCKTALQWSAKDRVVPTVTCKVFATSSFPENCSPLTMESRSAGSPSPPTIEASSRRIAKRNIPTTNRSGGATIDVTSFCKHPGLWAGIALDILLEEADSSRKSASNSSSEPSPSAALVTPTEAKTQRFVRVHLKLRFVLNTMDDKADPAPRLSSPLSILRTGHIAFTSLRATGSFLSNCHLNSTASYTIAVRWGSSPSVTTRIAQVDAIDKAVSWLDGSVTCDSQSAKAAELSTAPLVVLQLCRASRESLTGPSQVIGEACLPVFNHFASNQHLVAMSLPIVGPTTLYSSSAVTDTMLKQTTGGTEPASENSLPTRPTKTGRRIGLLSFEVQFLPALTSIARDLPPVAVTEPNLIIHELEGWQGTLVPTLCRTVVMDVSLIMDSLQNELWRSGVQGGGITTTVPLQAGTTSDPPWRLSTVFDLSAADRKLARLSCSTGPAATASIMIVVHIRDIDSSPLGKVMIPVRRSNRQWFLAREHYVWRNVYQSLPGLDHGGDEPVARMKLSIQSEVPLACSGNSPISTESYDFEKHKEHDSDDSSGDDQDEVGSTGWLYVQVIEVVEETTERGCTGRGTGTNRDVGVCVGMRLTRQAAIGDRDDGDENSYVRSRNRTTTCTQWGSDNSTRWQWRNEVFSFRHIASQTQSLQVFVNKTMLSCEMQRLDGILNVNDCVQQASQSTNSTGNYDQSLTSEDWFPIMRRSAGNSNSNGEPTITCSCMLVHLRFHYAPCTARTVENLVLRFMVESVHMCHVMDTAIVKTYVTGSFGASVSSGDASSSWCTSAIRDIDPGCTPATSLRALEGISLDLPLLLVHWDWPRVPVLMLQLVGTTGASKREVCVGEVTAVPLPALIATLTSCARSAPVRMWLPVWAKHDPAQRVALLSAMMTLVPYCQHSHAQPRCTRNRQRLRRPAAFGIENVGMWSSTVAMVMRIWKKLFYLLDENQNGEIDVNEFTSLFQSKLQGLAGTSDGALLLDVLFPCVEQRQQNIAVVSAVTTANRKKSTLYNISTQAIEAVFAEMDVNHDQRVEWNEYLRFLQTRLATLEPIPPPTVPLIADTSQHDCLKPPHGASCVSRYVEARKKKKEDTCLLITSPASAEASVDASPSALQLLGQVNLQSQARPDSRPIWTSPTRTTSKGKSRGKAQESEVPPHELERLQAHARSLETMLALEKHKNQRLQAELQAQQRINTQLQLQQQRDRLMAQSRAEWTRTMLHQHDRARLEREAARQKRHAASVVLQSRVRTRLECKRFLAVKLVRHAAATRIASLIRMRRARALYQDLQAMDALQRRREQAARLLQRALRRHVTHQQRLLFAQARAVSIVVLQQYVRRYLASRELHRRRRATIRLQRFMMHCLDSLRVSRRVIAWNTLRRWLDVCTARMRRHRMSSSIRQLQQWWCVVSRERNLQLMRWEAAVCVQAMWRGAHVRHRSIQTIIGASRDRHVVDCSKGDGSGVNDNAADVCALGMAPPGTKTFGGYTIDRPTGTIAQIGASKLNVAINGGARAMPSGGNSPRQCTGDSAIAPEVSTSNTDHGTASESDRESSRLSLNSDRCSGADGAVSIQNELYTQTNEAAVNTVSDESQSEKIDPDDRVIGKHSATDVANGIIGNDSVVPRNDFNWDGNSDGIPVSCKDSLENVDERWANNSIAQLCGGGNGVAKYRTFGAGTTELLSTPSEQLPVTLASDGGEATNESSQRGDTAYHMEDPTCSLSSETPIESTTNVLGYSTIHCEEGQVLELIADEQEISTSAESTDISACFPHNDMTNQGTEHARYLVDDFDTTTDLQRPGTNAGADIVKLDSTEGGQSEDTHVPINDAEGASRKGNEEADFENTNEESSRYTYAIDHVDPHDGPAVIRSVVEGLVHRVEVAVTDSVANNDCIHQVPALKTDCEITAASDSHLADNDEETHNSEICGSRSVHKSLLVPAHPRDDTRGYVENEIDTLHTGADMCKAPHEQRVHDHDSSRDDNKGERPDNCGDGTCGTIIATDGVKSDDILQTVAKIVAQIADASMLNS